MATLRILVQRSLLFFLLSYLLLLLLFHKGLVQEAGNIVKDVPKESREHFSQKRNLKKYDPDERTLRKVKPSWRFQNIPNGYVYSAYFDDRNNTKFVRLIAMMHRYTFFRKEFYCLFPKSNGDFEHVAGKTNLTEYMSPVIMYQMCENHGKQYGGWILSCQVPIATTEDTPHSIQLFRRKRFSHTLEQSATVAVYSPITSKQTSGSFSVCTPPLFDEVNPYRLVQFIEMNRLLGADHITFYNFNTTKVVNKILDFYEKQGKIEVVPWDIPVSEEEEVWYYGQLLTINDCLYRNMFHFNYTAFYDLDELLVPRNASNWHAMLSQLPALPSVVGYSFQSAFFLPAKGYSYNTDIIYTQNTKRVAKLSRLRKKVLVKGDSIFELGIHHVSRPLLHKQYVEVVSDKVGLIHHYRSCTTEFETSMDCYTHISDTHLVQYKAAFIERYKDILDQFYKSGQRVTQQ
ncbi:beta-1,4-galactosyltransferase galt-1 [Lingula anatina]|uniref:Glycosyltransferase family 92 protein n=1 Tax=Lingula anatina TaxID=7574 RepID=A0A1S3JYH5_LINAN|nr:beta-1,4-galactosyltransferase galt-1 [Lingula anatina]XP_013415346.1 beta-1,4-galactosyltransferase galt-1 [Lingula anatina]XP_023930172.1 beta-1,4-galactosyltransferase galt-1 [Lingula anatina]XP_023930173.1 beta-1,4-galactosyltransferase galt-1 [Lingula anatina]|eukprot:XP_013415345.1 beta-1,4-galactosyltransferase galt-1 [Lingula anatina]